MLDAVEFMDRVECRAAREHTYNFDRWLWNSPRALRFVGDRWLCRLEAYACGVRFFVMPLAALDLIFVQTGFGGNLAEGDDG